MQYIVMLLVCIRSYLTSFLRDKFSFWIPIIRTLYVYAKKDVWIRGYFSKPKGARELRSLGKTALLVYSFPCLLQGTRVVPHPLSDPCFGASFAYFPN